MSKMHFGVDMGGTSAKLALVSSNKKILWESEVSSKGHPRPLDLVKKIAQSAAPILKKHRINRIGVGIAGDIDFHHGVVRISPNLNWKNVPLKNILKKVLKKQIIVDNDANVAAWGIYQTQTPASVKNIIVVTIGTGVGGGLIWNGQVHRGATGSAGEIGHMILEKNGRACNCGSKGCLEAYSGGAYLVREAKKGMLTDSSLYHYFKKSNEKLSPLGLAKAAKAGNPPAKKLWFEAGTRLGQAMGNLIYIFNPEMIFLTGGVAQAGSLILNPMHQSLKKRPFTTPVKAATIKLAKNAPQMGVIGAALL